MAKKALVWKEDYMGRVAGQIERVGEASEIDSWSHHLKSKMSIADVPVELESLEGYEMDTAFVNDKWTRDGFADESAPVVFAVDTWIKDGQADVTVDPADETYTMHLAGDLDQRYTFVPEHYVLSMNAAKDKEKRIAEKYNLMTTDVLASMTSVFGTTSTESANAYNETWKKMIASPASYSAQGITARFAIAGLQVGDALDTDQKVTDYANAKLAEVDQYGVDRMVRIEQFRSEKAAIEAE
jgi:hypothetical protein